MSKRVSPIERIRAEIDDLFASDCILSEVLEEVARLSVRLVMQAGVDAEVDAFLQRVRYERRGEDHPSGFRNGWQPEAPIKTTMGPVKIQRPKVRDTDEKFCSRLLGKEVTPRTRGLFLATSGDLRWPPARTQTWPLTWEDLLVAFDMDCLSPETNVLISRSSWTM